MKKNVEVGVMDIDGEEGDCERVGLVEGVHSIMYLLLDP